MADVSGTSWTKPGIRYANRAWWDFLTASNRNSPIDDRKWVRVMEYHKFRGVPHIHALITEAKAIVEAWRQDYNTVRPQSSLGNRTPEQAVREELPLAAGLA